MIKFEVKDSPDRNVISSYEYFQNQIYLGKTNGSLQINDKDLHALHIMLEVIGTELIIHAQKNVEFFLINGKRSSAVKKIKKNDQITIGATTLIILDFTETIHESKKGILEKKLNQLIEENSPLLAVIERLTKRIK